MKNNINKKIGATLLTATVIAGAAIIPMSNAAAEEATKNPSISYQAHVQNEDWMPWVKNGEEAGTHWKSQRMEALRIKLENCDDVVLHIKAHIQDHGDREYTVTAKDADKIIGTKWEARRMEAITITSEGLHEKGYKLQYQVHVQDIGDQGWKEEGEEAGTHWQAKRLEAIRIRVVEDVELVKANAVAKLEKYDTVLKVTVTPEATYKKLSEQIKATIEEVKIASDKATVEELMTAQIKKIEKITTPKTIEEIVKEEEEKLQKAVAAANERFDAYESFIPKAQGLTQNDKDRLKAIVSDARTKVAEAKLSSEITEKTDFKTIESSTKGIFGDFKSLVNAQFELDEKLKDYEELVKEQENANTKISIYEIAMKDTTYSEEYKKLAQASINTAKDEVKNAESVEKVTEAINKLESTLGGQFKEILDVATEEIEKNELAKAINEAKEALSEYVSCGYAEIEEKAKGYIAEIEKMTNKESVEKVAEEKLEELLELKEKADEDKEKYETAKKAALIKLNATLLAIEELELPEEEINSISNMIALTKEKIESVATVDDVEKAETVFNNYMEKYYKDILDDVKESQFNEIKQNALATLAQYIDSKIESVKDLAVETTTQIEGIKTAEENTGDIITQKLTEAMATIELEIAKNDAKTVAESLKAELKPYTNTSNLDKVRVRANVAIDTIEETMNAINSMTTASKPLDEEGNEDAKGTAVEAVEQKVEEMKNVKKEAIKAINQVINENSAEIAKQLKETKEKAGKEVNKYIELAKAVQNTELVKSLNTYSEFIKNATRVSEINNVVSFDGKNELTSDCLLSQLIENTLLKERAEAIEKIETVYHDSHTDSQGNVFDVDVKNDKTLEAKINELIAEVKNSKTTKERIAEIVTDNTGDLAVAIKNAQDDYAELKSAKDTAKELIETELTTTGTGANEFATYSLKQVIKGFADEIDAVKLTQYDADKTIFDGIVEKALARVKDELKIVLVDYADTEFEKVLEEKPDAVKDTVTAEIAKFEALKVETVDTTDKWLGEAVKAKTAIDSAIEAL